MDTMPVSTLVASSKDLLNFNSEEYQPLCADNTVVPESPGLNLSVSSSSLSSPASVPSVCSSVPGPGSSPSLYNSSSNSSVNGKISEFPVGAIIVNHHAAENKFGEAPASAGVLRLKAKPEIGKVFVTDRKSCNIVDVNELVVKIKKELDDIERKSSVDQQQRCDKGEKRQLCSTSFADNKNCKEERDTTGGGSIVDNNSVVSSTTQGYDNGGSISVPDGQNLVERKKNSLKRSCPPEDEDDDDSSSRGSYLASIVTVDRILSGEDPQPALCSFCRGTFTLAFLVILN